MPCRRFAARIVVFDVVVPIMKGTRAELYCHSLCEPCTIVKLVSSINKANGNVIKERPRYFRYFQGKFILDFFPKKLTVAKSSSNSFLCNNQPPVHSCQTLMHAGLVSSVPS